MRYVRNKENERRDTNEQPTNTNTGVEMMRKKQVRNEERAAGIVMDNKKRKKVHLRSNEEKHCTGIHD
jgi:hypothetical protein